MRKFGKLEEVVEYIRQDENVENYRWSNAANSNWDIDDILCNAGMYDDTYPGGYAVDTSTYSIFGADTGEELISRVERYYIDYGTGAGNEWVSGTLEEAMEQAEDGLAYTQASVTIKNDAGEEVANLPWWGVAPGDDDTVTAQFGSFGFYGEWVIL